MSAEEAVTDALQTPVDQNAQAAEDAKKMLAELEGEAATVDEPKETNGTAESTDRNDEAPKEGKTEATKETTVEKNGDSEKPREHRRNDRSDHGGRGRGRDGRSNYTPRNYRDNIKSDLTTQEVTDDPVAIRKQVEFYFSDSNLPNDKFLLSKVGGSQNNSVELKILHTFKRMRHFQPFEAIVEAMRESNFLELTEDDTCVRRREPLPESLNDGPDPNAVRVFEDRAMPRSVYAKGFGEEVPSTQFDIEAFFSPYGPTNAVRLRRSDDKVFKGSVFVEFETEDLANAFLALDPKPKYKGKDLQIMSKKEYCDKKVEDIKSGKIRPNNKYGKNRRDDRGGRDAKRKRDEEDTRDWRTRREDDRKRGFRDDRRRGDRGRDSRGGRGGRFNGTERDERGIPAVKASAPKAKDDGGRDDAIAKAKAAVEAENKKEREEKETTDKVESKEQDGAVEPSTKTVAENAQGDADAAAGKKRAREEDDGDLEAQRASKKVNVKEAHPVDVAS